MRISYAIPVCYEHEEIRRLLTLLVENKRQEDEIVVQSDMGNTTADVYKVLYDEFPDKIKHVQFPLKGNFGAFKNNLKSHCAGEWIFQIDADEYFNAEFIRNLHLILQQNPETHVFLLARINKVEGITDQHIQKWRWQVNEKGWINFPDWQPRILQNSPKINWVNKVHEVLVGHTTYGFFPSDEEYCILHNKNIARQEVQNTLYSAL
jgi:glycosyltransferase involved in cell wall biosynthesis